MWILTLFIIVSLYLILWTAMQEISRDRKAHNKKEFMEHQLTAEYQERQATIDWILNH